ncbi:MAG TPA: hypothetical protein VNB06_05555 [Thermoanaerobaculia bacterium]|nr:hypothetical protein [Thermoanaerobaculia bacterium]
MTATTPTTFSPILQKRIDQASRLRSDAHTGDPAAAALEDFIRERAEAEGVHPVTVANRLLGDHPLGNALAGERANEIHRELFQVWQSIRERWIRPDQNTPATLAHTLGAVVADLLAAADQEDRDEVRRIIREYVDEPELVQ